MLEPTLRGTACFILALTSLALVALTTRAQPAPTTRQREEVSRRQRDDDVARFREWLYRYAKKPDQECAQRLQDWVKNHPDDGAALYWLAWAHRRKILDTELTAGDVIGLY